MPTSDAGTPRDARSDAMVADGARPDGSTASGDATTDASSNDGSTIGMTHGEFAVTSTYTFRGPITRERSVGDLVKDLVLHEAVSRSSVPGFLEDEAEDVLDQLVGNAIADAVDDSGPAMEFVASDAYRLMIEATFDVDAESHLALTFEGGRARGTERFDVLSTTIDGHVARIDRLSGVVSTEAEWQMTRGDGATWNVEPHAIEIDTSPLVLRAAELTIGADGITALRTAASAIVPCDAVALAITGGDAELTFEVEGVEASIEVDELEAACVAIKTEVGRRVLDLFSIDTQVEVGGPVLVADRDADGAIDELRSGEGFGGIVRIGPEALAPRVSVVLRAVR